MSDQSTAAEAARIDSSNLFLDDVLDGLESEPRSLPCKYFYDQRGSELFDQICELDEYYLTRSELAIMDRFAEAMAEQIDEGVMLVELGSGSSVKTRILLDHLHDPVAYVPVDISREHLLQTADNLANAYPHIEILPVCSDFTEVFELPESRRPPTHVAVYFPGSTIGNFEAREAGVLLARISQLVGPGGGLLIGIDLQKEPSRIEAAYNDTEGVTAEFNLNLLNRINRELAGDFDLDQFNHQAVYDAEAGRVKISVVSQRPQTVTVSNRRFELQAGEAICTEYSHKYTLDGFAALAARTGFALHDYWTDPDALFAVLHLVVE